METLIQFFYEEVDFSLDHEDVIHDWVLNSIRKEGLQAGVINVIFCSDEYLLDLNQRFLDRDTLTDVIAFDYGEGGDDVSGEVFISYDRISENRHFCRKGIVARYYSWHTSSLRICRQKQRRKSRNDIQRG